MKRILTHIVILGFVVSCSKDTHEPKETSVLKMMQSERWNLEKASVGTVDITPEFVGMTLTFEAETYSTVGGGVLWPATGTWGFTSSVADEILRDADLLVTIVEISNNRMVLEFLWERTVGVGRVKSIGGNYRFTFLR